MKRVTTPRSPAFVALLAATAMAGPAFAQAVATLDTPTVTATQTPPAPAPAAPVATANPVFAPNAEVVQPIPPRPAPVAEAAPEAPAAEPVQRRAANRATPPARAAAPSAVARERAAVAAPAAIATAETLTPPVEDTTPTEIAPAPIPEPAVGQPAPEPVAAVDLNWLWLALAVLVSGVAAVMLLGRRRRVAAYAYDAADDIVAPAAAPVADVDLNARPYIRLSVQPVATRDRDGEQLVDYLVLVENEGKLEARDVRVSQFVTSDGGGIPTAPETRRIDVASGASVPLEGEIALHGASAAHIVVDARYPLPDGREGRLAARFGIDLSTQDLTAQVEDVMERV